MKYKHPPRSDLYLIHELVPIPAELKGPSLERVAHHEASHIVMMRWAGFEPTHATASERGGIAHWAPDEQPPDLAAIEYDQPLAAAQAASVFHAGIIGELLYVGLPWTGLLCRFKSRDWQSAALMLSTHFGGGSAGHGFAQRTALAVLSERWPEVQRIAAHLTENGEWRPEDDN